MLFRENSAYNEGDVGYYEDDGAGLEVDYYYDQMKKEENKEKNKVYKREPNAKVCKVFFLKKNLKVLQTEVLNFGGSNGSLETFFYRIFITFCGIFFIMIFFL